MRQKRWAGLHYIDLFAGAGIERLKGTGQLDWGSPLIAAQAKHRFARLHLCDLDQLKITALRQRLTAFPQPSEPQILQGDCNLRINDVVSAIPTGTLSLAFLDPYGLQLHFETVRAISRARCDLILFFPDHLDALRNWAHYYFEQEQSNLDRVLGTPSWRATLSESNRDNHPLLLRRLYETQLRTLGYTHFDYERISRRNDGRYLYLLMFCSRDPAGGKIWRGISQRKPGDQTHFQW